MRCVANHPTLAVLLSSIGIDFLSSGRILASRKPQHRERLIREGHDVTEASAPPGLLPGEILDEIDEDTEPQEQPDTAANTQQAQQPTVDWDSDANPYKGRHREAQSWGTKAKQRVTELEQQLLSERQQRQQQPVDPNDPLAVREAQLAARERQINEAQEWSAIRAEHPPELLDAYTVFQRGYQIDPSPKGAIAAYQQSVLAFASALNASEPAPKPALPTRAEAVKPVVDTSRSDAPDPDAITQRIAGAKERKDIEGHVGALLTRWFKS